LHLRPDFRQGEGTSAFVKESSLIDDYGAGGIRILLVDDHPLIRESLRMLIQREADLKVCGEAEDREEALALAADHEPHLALVDLTLKNSQGLELIKDFIKLRPPMRILVLSVQDEVHYAERVVCIGAHGYISKSEPPVTILQAIRRVLAGEIYWSEKSAARIVSKIAHSSLSGTLSGVNLLTDRELQVFELIGTGKSTQQIAELLRITTSTVETYRARIKEKLHFKDKGELLQHAIRWGNAPKH
jgi:DNA-binding NarL/FixJ family response regulator